MITVVTPLAPLWVSQQHGTKWWIVREDYSLAFDDLLEPSPYSKGYAITIPAGYRYDRSSIPDAVAWLVSKDDLGCVAPLIHDTLYSNKGMVGSTLNDRYPACNPWRKFSRAETDELFYQIMLADKVRPWKARVAFWAVRLFGGKW